MGGMILATIRPQISTLFVRVSNTLLVKINKNTIIPNDNDIGIIMLSKV